MTSPSRALTFGGNPFREWTGHDGEPWFALAPWVIAVREQLKGEGLDHDLYAVERRRDELYHPLEPVDAAVMRRMIEIDTMQRENGYDGP